MSTPTQPGFYWAKIRLSFFDSIVEVSGDAPFFTVRGWNHHDERCGRIEPHEIKEWGPRIANPNRNEEAQP